ncbi:hypothetical protein [Methylococcus geothermalis]|uniref:Uncharacterized protein n=1 Tax=Methylococcus geothermalis TaxID=2681310 RepID=A0A858Q4F0_9GAMM|nr:hypothetical protein [Methylococcus geothermalis]QJD28712.1 hypothetical protein GNH96_01155 [Methylococcus geothermalis]
MKPTIDAGRLPPIAAEYETVSSDTGGNAHVQSNRWHFWRDADFVETRSLDTDEGEIWRRSVKGLIFYERVFHRDRKVVESNPDDLRARSRYPLWSKVALLIDPGLLNSRLQFEGRETLEGRQALRYGGQVDGVGYEILWLERENIPGVIRQRFPEREVTVTLRSLYSLQDAPWPHDVSGNYSVIDYADLGDMESDPFVKRILHETDVGDGHDHAH